MTELMQENWIFLVLALVIGLLVAWWVLVANRRARVEIKQPDEDAPVRRNQTLIDAPPAATPANTVPPPTPETLAGAGEAVAAAVAPVVVPSSPAALSTPVPSAEDDLTRIKGLGPKLSQQLRELGVTSFAQIAAWSDAEIDQIDAKLGRFQGRIRRDDWPAQARLLAAGDTAGYEAKFGKL